MNKQVSLHTQNAQLKEQLKIFDNELIVNTNKFTKEAEIYKLYL